LLGPKFAEMEEKYDLQGNEEGFGEEGDSDTASSDEESFTDDSSSGEDY